MLGAIVRLPPRSLFRARPCASVRVFRWGHSQEEEQVLREIESDLENLRKEMKDDAQTLQKRISKLDTRVSKLDNGTNRLIPLLAALFAYFVSR